MNHMFIDPSLIKLYEWNSEEYDEYIDIILTLPEKFPKDLLECHLESDGLQIVIPLKNQPPILAGYLYKKIKNIQKFEENNLIIFRLIKEKPEKWELIIKHVLENHNITDPKSAFLLSSYYFNNTNEIQIALDFLKISVSFRYPDALIQASQLEINEKNYDNGKILLELASDKYQNINSSFLLGLLYVSHYKNYQLAIKYFEFAGKNGSIDSLNCLGEIYSPCQEPYNEFEDANKAFQYFNEVINKEPNYAYSLMNLARLYANGKGTKKNIELAKLYKSKALELIPTMESFEINEKSNNLIPLITISLSILTLSFITYKIIKKKK